MKSSFALARLGGFLLILLMTAVGLAACGGGGDNSGGAGPVTLSRIEVTPAAPSIAAGTTQQFVAMAIYSDNSRQDVSSTATWASSDASVATISSTGLATSQKVGTTTIAAKLGTVTGTTLLTVTSATLRSIAVSGDKSSLASGQSEQLTATGTYSDGTTQNLSNSVTWTSSNTAVATVTAQGVVQGTGVGSASITATSGSIQGSFNISITAAVISRLSIAPKTAAIANGTTRQYSATAIYSDNSTQDVTTSTSWSSSDTTIATISNTTGSVGLAQGAGVGNATISGSYMGVSDTGSLQVSAATLVSIAVTPASASIAKGLTQQFMATGSYTDRSTQDLTTMVTWSSSDTSIATISNASGSQGLAQGTAVGNVTVTASQPNSTITGTASLSVSSAVVTGVGVTPSTATVPKGLGQQYMATATFSDNSTQDVTTSTTWTSSDTTVATISNADGSRGAEQSVDVGTTSITGNYAGFDSTPATLNVSAAALQSIAVTPTQPTIAKGLTQQFMATGTYTDNSTQDLTPTVTWTSSDTSIATISNNAGSQGLAQGVATGTATISAASGNTTGVTTLTVTSAVVQSISITPANASVAKGLSQQFTATALLSDSSTQDVTTSTTWSSSDTTVATISNAAGSQGLAMTPGAGSATITGTYAGFAATAALTVTNAQLASIAVTPGNASVANGQTQQFAATGVYTDNSTADITTSVIWSSTTTSVATISNASGSQGLAQTASTGSTTITATQSGGSINGTATLTVTAAVLSRIDVTPPNATVPKGLGQQYTATAVYSDNSTQDATNTVTWASSNTAVATISNASGSKGLLQGVNQGNTTITATDSASSIAGTTQVTVSAAVLKSIGVTPTNSKVAPGFSLQYTATGTYSDSSTQNITTSVTWATDNMSFATISNASGSQGLATATAAGGGSAVTITASLSGVSSSTNLTITSATLTSIAVTPATPSVAKGFTKQFTATGTFTDNSTNPATTYTQDLTAQVSWTSSSTTVATISNAKGSQGLATVVGSSGNTTITATLINSANASPGKSGNTTLTATAAVVVSIAISPQNPSISKGSTQQFSAIGTFSDGSTSDITTTVPWSASSSNVATISNASGSQGLATSVGVGSVTIFATINGVQQSTTLTVTAATLKSIAVTPASASVSAGLTQQYVAMGTYSDNSKVTITTSVTWSTSDTSVATISNASASQGLATTLKVGSVLITATDPATGISNDNNAAPIKLTVTAATLNSIKVSPNPSMVSTGQTTQLTVTGSYSDGSTPDLTTQATWSSNNTAAATVGAMTGVVTGVSPGTATPSTPATATITATFGGKTSNSALTIYKAPLVSIKVTFPTAGYSNPSQMPISYSTPYTATGTYQDGSTLVITPNVTWTIANTADATVSNTSGTNGVVTGVAVGNTTVSATMGSVTSNNANVSIVATTLSSISVTPGSATIKNGGIQPFLATGTFKDGSTIDITNYNGVAWASSNTNVATIDQNTGLATGKMLAGTGISTNITATKGTIVNSPASTLQ